MWWLYNAAAAGTLWEKIHTFGSMVSVSDLEKEGIKHSTFLIASSWQRWSSKHPKKSFKCPQRSLENVSWRVLKTLRERWSKKVHGVIKNKGDHNKYWPSSWLELNKLCFCPIWSIFILWKIEKHRQKWKKKDLTSSLFMVKVIHSAKTEFIHM